MNNHRHHQPSSNAAAIIHRISHHPSSSHRVSLAVFEIASHRISHHPSSSSSSSSMSKPIRSPTAIFSRLRPRLLHSFVVVLSSSSSPHMNLHPCIRASIQCMSRIGDRGRKWESQEGTCEFGETSGGRGKAAEKEIGRRNWLEKKVGNEVGKSGTWGKEVGERSREENR